MANEHEVPGTKKVTPPAGRDSITFLQMQSLLSAVNTYMAFLANGGNIDDHKGGAMDGGVKAAAESTFIGLCSRMDAMIADESRWTMDAQNDLEQSLMILYADQRSFIKHQREAVAIMKSPHNRFKPTLVKMDNGTWAAFHGDPNNQDSAIIGVGMCPEDALTNFDDVFAGRIIYETNKNMDGQGTIVPGGQSGQTAGAGDSEPPRKKRGKRAAKAAKAPKKGSGGKSSIGL